MPPSLDTENQLAAVRSDIEGHRRLAAQVRAEAQALAREAELADRRVQAILAERTEWQNRKQSAASQIATIEARVTEVTAERAELDNAPALFAEKRSALISEIEHAENDRRVAADALAAAETAMAETDRAAKISLEALSSAREATARAEERMEGTKRRLADIEREIHDMLEVEPQARGRPRRDRSRAPNCRRWPRSRRISKSCAATASGSAPSICAPRKSCARSRPSTPRSPPSATIWSKPSSGCARASRASTAKRASGCLTSFETVNAHFKRLFVELFGGGEAALHLIESDDPLEAGLEIIAKPPGKKPQTLSLLSGGEQALTALALIFAVFLTNPSPICVLDEVDAPLDDHNVERFCNLLHEMTSSDRDALHHHHAQSDHDGADEPAVRRHHGRARRVATGLGRPRRRGEDSRSERGVTSLAVTPIDVIIREGG